MTVITGNIQDIGLDPLSGVLIATSVQFRTTGDIVIAPEARSYHIAAGLVSADLIPGPTRLTIQVGSHARDSFDVIVPDEGPVTLAWLIDSAVEWSPAVVSAVAEHRAAAEQARDEAVAAAGAAASSASDADVSAGDAAVAAGAAAQSASDAAGSASAAASSAGAAAQSASSADGSASDAAGAVVDARAARDAAEGHASSAAGSASAAAGSAAAADGHAGRAEAAANEFDLTATSSTLAPGAAATVTVSGDGPAYSLAFGVPQGPKGDKGDEGEISQAQLDAAVASLVDNAPEALNTLSELSTALGDDPNFATTVSTQIGQRAKIDGAPAEYDTLGKLVAALQAGDLGGSTDAAELAGALTNQIDASAATVESDLAFPGGPGVTTNTVAGWMATLYYMGNLAMEGLGSKSDVGHQHPVSDLTATGTASSTTYLRGNGTWATPPNTTYSVPTQAEAEAGTATTARAFSAQRVRQAIDARAVTRQGSTQGLWIGTTANLPATGTAGVLYVTYE